MAQYRSYSTAPAIDTSHVPGLAEKPPYWLTEGIPNCYACEDNYAKNQGCDRCDRVAEKLLLSDEALLLFAEGSHEQPPTLVKDPVGGLVLPLL